MSSQEPNITLYTTQTPNGIKISITLEELGIPYKVHKIDISKNTQKEDWFLKINPNGRIPALTDTFTDGKPINLFESGSIMQYLVRRYDPEYKISYPEGTREWYEMNNWLFFQNAGVGPMQGQASMHGFFQFCDQLKRREDRTKCDAVEKLYKVDNAPVSAKVDGCMRRNRS